MHNCIENYQKGKVIYALVQWVILVSFAKVTGEPNTVFGVSDRVFRFQTPSR